MELSRYVVRLKFPEKPEMPLEFPIHNGTPCDQVVAEHYFVQGLGVFKKHNKKVMHELWALGPDGSEEKIREEKVNID